MENPPTLVKTSLSDHLNNPISFLNLHERANHLSSKQYAVLSRGIRGSSCSILTESADYEVCSNIPFRGVTNLQNFNLSLKHLTPSNSPSSVILAVTATVSNTTRAFFINESRLNVSLMEIHNESFSDEPTILLTNICSEYLVHVSNTKIQILDSSYMSCLTTYALEYIPDIAVYDERFFLCTSGADLFVYKIDNSIRLKQRYEFSYNISTVVLDNGFAWIVYFDGENTVLFRMDEENELLKYAEIPTSSPAVAIFWLTTELILYLSCSDGSLYHVELARYFGSDKDVAADTYHCRQIVVLDQPITSFTEWKSHKCGIWVIGLSDKCHLLFFPWEETVRIYPFQPVLRAK